VGCSEGQPVNHFIPSENLKHFNPLEPGVDEQTRSTVLKLLLHEAEKSCLTRQRLDRIDRHMAALRQLIYRQVELVEKGHNGERALKLLVTLNDLMANYQTLHQRISPAG
jgi:hypothetical protein